MNRLLIFVAFFTVLCSACSVPARIDATTDDKFEQSLDRVRASLAEDRRQTFDDYGYRKPLDGTAITPTPFDLYHEPEKADCGSFGSPKQ